MTFSSYDFGGNGISPKVLAYEPELGLPSDEIFTFNQNNTAKKKTKDWPWHKKIFLS